MGKGVSRIMIPIRHHSANCEARSTKQYSLFTVGSKAGLKRAVEKAIWLSSWGILDHSWLRICTLGARPSLLSLVATVSYSSFSNLYFRVFPYNRAVSCAFTPYVFHIDGAVYKQQQSYVKDSQKLLSVGRHIAQPHLIRIRERHIALIVSLGAFRGRLTKQLGFPSQNDVF